MSESKKRLTESVSALVDGEVSELELHRILKELELETANQSEHNDQGIAGKWSRYNLISQAMASTPLKGKDISQSVSDAIAREPNQKIHFLQNIRDEVHRFAITSHRSKRSKMSIRSVFDDLKGIGPERKKILKKHFGSVESLKIASLEELKEVKSIPKNILVKIYEYFHSV